MRSVQKGNLAWASKLALPLSNKLALPLFVLALAAFVYSLYGFNGVLLRDYSIYLYSGQRMAEGVPPYVSIFDHKGPLSPMLAGLGVVLSKQLNWDDIYTVRLVFFTVGCLTVVAVYLLGKSLFRSQIAGFFAALTFLGFYAYGYSAASGPEPKTPMVLFQALSLLFTSQKRWFWAGLFGSLSFLVWQPMAIFAVVTFVLAIMRPKEERYGAVLRALAGIMVPLIAIVAYFYYHDALGDFINGFIIFNLLYLARGDTQLVALLGGAASNVALRHDDGTPHCWPDHDRAPLLSKAVSIPLCSDSSLFPGSGSVVPTGFSVS
jgi:DolP-mannose mannosyltransferase/Dolichyl-phosphate-mannose-protein mannosyltransferase